jgi:hypothetical protein
MDVINPPQKAIALEWRRKVGRGATGVQIVNAVDEGGERVDLFIKFRQPPTGHGNYGRTSLACELICSMLARALELSVPDYYIVEINKNLVRSLPESNYELKSLFAKNEGLVFGTSKLKSYSDWPSDKVTEDKVLLDQLEGVICFDGAVFNGDRKKYKTNMLWDGNNHLAIIDHALALATVYNNSRSPRPSDPFPREEISKHCATKSLQSERKKERAYEDLYERWRGIVNDETLNAICESIPQGWERQPSGDLEKIFAFLRERHTSFEPTTQKIKKVVR